MELDADLSLTLAMVADAMRPAQSPWWVIGSAAVALHGAAPIMVADVDILLSVEDARAVLPATGLAVTAGGEHPDFRSEIFATWTEPSLAVEFMAGFAFRQGAQWQMLRPQTRQAVEVAGATVYIPERHELLQILEAFDRPKDRDRAALLRALG